jgi:hypothetical protein
VQYLGQHKLSRYDTLTALDAMLDKPVPLEFLSRPPDWESYLE